MQKNFQFKQFIYNQLKLIINLAEIINMSHNNNKLIQDKNNLMNDFWYILN